jgi:hypothetical protein
MPGQVRRDPLWEATLVFALALIAYTANGRTIGSGDTLPARYLPLSILRSGDFYLDDFPVTYEAGRKAYWQRSVAGHTVSFYPVGAAIAALPFYAPAVVLRGAAAAEARGAELEKIAAAGIVAVSVALIYTLVCGLAGRWMAITVTAAYALGSSSLSASSQALWQHGPAQLAIALGIFLLVKAKEGAAWLAPLAGLPLAFSAVCRPTNAMLVAPVAAYVLLVGRQRAFVFVAAAAPAVLFQLWYNAEYLGGPFVTQFGVLRGSRWNDAVAENLQGLLFSPARGLFFYSPVFVFSVLGAALVWRRQGDPLLRALTIGVLLVLAVYGHWWIWWGGSSYGPRLIADLTPVLAILLCPCEGLLSRSLVLRAVFAAALLWSIAAHSIGAYWDDGSWNGRLGGLAGHTEILWTWDDNPVVNAIHDLSSAACHSWLGGSTPLDPDVEEQLLAQFRRDPRHDQPLLVLRDRYQAAGDHGAAEQIEALRRARFTPGTAVGWRFDDALTLLGIDWRTTESGAMVLVYYWRAERLMASDYAAYTRLEGEGCGAANDHVLGLPGRPTTHWLPGDTFKQGQELPAGAAIPPSGCSLRLGVWSPQDRRRLYIRHFPLWQLTRTLLSIAPSASGVRIVPAQIPR